MSNNVNYCKVCNLKPLFEYDICYDCLVLELDAEFDDIPDSSLVPDKLLDESLTKYSINREDRANHINPQLSCSLCPPHRGENARRCVNKLAARRPKQKTQSKNIKQGSEFKRRQHRDY